MFQTLFYLCTFVVLIQGNDLSNIDDEKAQKIKDLIERLSGIAAIKLNEGLSNKIDEHVNNALDRIKSLDSSCSSPASSGLELIRTSFKKQLNECSAFLPDTYQDLQQSWDYVRQDFLWAINLPIIAVYQIFECIIHPASIDGNIFYCLGHAIPDAVKYSVMDVMMILDIVLKPVELGYRALVRVWHCVDQDVLISTIHKTVSDAHYCHQSLPLK